MCALGAGFRLLIPAQRERRCSHARIKLRLPLVAMTFILFVGATDGASQLGCCELAEQMGCRQSVQR